MAVGAIRLEGESADVDLRLKGKIISRCCIDAAFSLEILEERSRTVIRIGGQMSIEHDGFRLSLSGEKPKEAAQASVLLGKTIGSAIAHGDGSLEIGFKDGSRLLVPVDPHYEAWEMNATDGFMVVSRPGGGLSTWSPR